MLRLLLPRSLGGQEMPSRRILQGHRGAGLGRCQRRPGSSTSRTSRRRPRPPPCRTRRRCRCSAARCRPGLGRAPQQQQGDPRRRRLSPDRHLELRQRRPPHQLAWRPQRHAEPRRHAAHPLRPAGRPQLRVPALAGQDHRRLARARPARHRQRHLLGRGPVRSRRARAGARRARRAAREGPALSPSARPCSMPPASAA